jgi:hypothetical protein
MPHFPEPMRDAQRTANPIRKAKQSCIITKHLPQSNKAARLPDRAVEANRTFRQFHQIKRPTSSITVTMPYNLAVQQSAEKQVTPCPKLNPATETEFTTDHHIIPTCVSFCQLENIRDSPARNSFSHLHAGHLPREGGEGLWRLGTSMMTPSGIRFKS